MNTGWEEACCVTSLNVRSNAAQAPRGGSSNQLAFGSWQSGIVDRVGLADSKRYRVAIWRIYVGRSIVGGASCSISCGTPAKRSRTDPDVLPFLAGFQSIGGQRCDRRRAQARGSRWGQGYYLAREYTVNIICVSLLWVSFVLIVDRRWITYIHSLRY